jgi:hypothetical protein
LSLHLKKHLSGKKFDDDDEVQEEVMMCFKGQAADFYDSRIQKLVARLILLTGSFLGCPVWTLPGDYVGK